MINKFVVGMKIPELSSKDQELWMGSERSPGRLVQVLFFPYVTMQLGDVPRGEQKSRIY